MRDPFAPLDTCDLDAGTCDLADETCDVALETCDFTLDACDLPAELSVVWACAEFRTRTEFCTRTEFFTVCACDPEALPWPFACELAVCAFDEALPWSWDAAA